jgi:hypothetical protein
MKKIILTLLFLTASCCFSQYNKIIASQMSVKFIEADTYVGNDNMGFDYFIKNNILFKFKDKEKYQYQNIYLGKISRVDLQNPLQVLIFYENFNTFITLDRQLNEIEKINLSDSNPNLIISATGIASQNNYWLFDQATQQLSLYNTKKNAFLFLGAPFKSPIKNYFSSYNLFFWVDQENRLYSCDIFGKTKEVTILPDYDAIYLTNERVIAYQKEGNLYFFDIENKTSIIIENIKKSFISFTYKNQNLAIFTAEGITNYKINLP